MTLRTLLLVATLVTAHALSFADDPPASKSEVDAETAKGLAIHWLDKFRQEQVLFHEEDIDRLRKQLAAGSAEEALGWWTKSAQVRAALDSPEWKDTRKWLKEFLKVQAIFSDEEIDRFRTEAKENVKKESPEDFMNILTEVEKYRRKLARGSRNARAMREHQLQVVEAFKQKQAAERAAARAAAPVPPSPVQPPVQRRPPRQPTAPLINSLDVARWRVMGGFWRY